MANKYKNKKCLYNGLKFDSILELDRWKFLQDCEKKGLISNLERQQLFPLKAIGDFYICTYIADFTYIKDNETIIEDAKGVLTEVFRLKAKMFYANYCQEIQIIDKANVTNLVPVKKKRKKKT